MDAYLAGISPEHLQLLDAATRTAERHLKEMVQELDLINGRLDRAFAQLSRRGPKIRKGG